VAANIVNKPSWTANTQYSSSLGVWQSANSSSKYKRFMIPAGHREAHDSDRWQTLVYNGNETSVSITLREFLD